MKKIYFLLSISILILANNAISQCTSLSLSANQTYGDQTFNSNSATNCKIGSFKIINPLNEDVQLTNLVLIIVQNSSAVLLNDISNLTIKDGSGLQLSTTVNHPNNLTNSFSLGVTMPMGNTKTIEVFADINSGISGTIQTALAYNATGLNTGNIYPLCTNGYAMAASLGQTITVTQGATNPIANFTLSEDTICDGDFVTIINLSDTGQNIICEWWFNYINPEHWVGNTVPMAILPYGYNGNTAEVRLSVCNTITGQCSYLQKEIYVYPKPINLQINPQNLFLGCNNEPITITASGMNATAFEWKDDQGNIVSTTNTFVAANSGEYKLFAFNNYGCSTDYPYQFYVNASQASQINIEAIDQQTHNWINNPDSISTCDNENGVQLHAYASTYSNGETYSWPDDGSTNPNKVATTTGWYKVDYKNEYGCTAKDSIYVIVHQKPTPTIVTLGQTTICGNGSITFAANENYSNYIWNGMIYSQGADKDTVTFIDQSDGTSSYSGNIFLEVTDNNGCVADANPVLITINANPTQPEIIQNGCALQTENLNIGNIATWYQGTTIVGNGEIFLPTVNDYYEVEITNSSGCSALSNFSFPFVMPASPVISIDNNTICEGSVATLFVQNPYNFNNLTWSNGNNGLSIEVNTSGTYSVSTDLGSCILISNPETVTVYPNPTSPDISGNMYFCDGTNNILSVPLILGYSYQWNNGITTHQNIVNSSGIYSVTVSDTNGCTSNSSMQVFNVPIPAPTLIQNECKISVGNPEPGWSYQWYKNGTVIFNAIDAYYSADSVGFYNVVATNTTCDGSSATIFLNCSSTSGISENELTGLNIYPIPFQNELTISLPGKFTVELINSIGQSIEKKEGSEKITFSTENLSRGIYFIKILSGKEVSIKKILKT